MEERANVLEVVSERLSKHVLANYDVFVRGINEAASVETDLQARLLQGSPREKVLLCAYRSIEARVGCASAPLDKS